jgi:hypothetical protein
MHSFYERCLSLSFLPLIEDAVAWVGTYGNIRYVSFEGLRVSIHASASRCVACNEDEFVFVDSSGNMSCVAACPTGFEGNSVSGYCQSEYVFLTQLQYSSFMNFFVHRSVLDVWLCPTRTVALPRAARRAYRALNHPRARMCGDCHCDCLALAATTSRIGECAVPAARVFARPARC